MGNGTDLEVLTATGEQSTEIVTAETDAADPRTPDQARHIGRRHRTRFLTLTTTTTGAPLVNFRLVPLPLVAPLVPLTPK